MGRTVAFESAVTLEPEAGVLAAWYDQESYVETSDLALPRAVDAYDRWSVRSLLGGTLAWESRGDVRIRPLVRAFWMHEFKADDDQLGYALVGGGDGHSMLITGPEEDLLVAGIGLDVEFKNGLGVGAGLDGVAGKDSAGATLAGRLFWAF